MISTITANRLLMKGCESFQDYAISLEDCGSNLADISVMCRFPNVFSEELLGLPPVRKIEFSIDLIPDTRPIAMASYRMAPIELKELKVQLQELLDKGFIRPSVSP